MKWNNFNLVADALEGLIAFNPRGFVPIIPSQDLGLYSNGSHLGCPQRAEKW